MAGGVVGLVVGGVVGLVVGGVVGVGVAVVPVDAVVDCVPQRWNSHNQNPQLLVAVLVVAALAAAVPLIAGRATPPSDTNTKAPATKHRRRFRLRDSLTFTHT